MELNILKDMRIGILSLVVLILMIPAVDAGVGIVYGVERAEIEEELVTCVAYGVYNPWEDNATVKVSARGEFANFTMESETVDIPSRTKHQDALPIDICFDIPETYEKECLFWKIGCKKECGEEVQYQGEIVASEVVEYAGGVTGSKVTGAVTAPLTLRINCKETERDMVSIAGLIGLVIFAMLSVLVWHHHREPISVRRQKKAERLMKKRQKLERKLREI